MEPGGAAKPPAAGVPLLATPAKVLHFTGPNTQINTAKIMLNNPTNRYVSFRLRTTAPHNFAMRPNGGTIGPMSNLEVVVKYRPTQPDMPGQAPPQNQILKIQLITAFVNSGSESYDFTNAERDTNVSRHRFDIEFTNPNGPGGPQMKAGVGAPPGSEGAGGHGAGKGAVIKPRPGTPAYIAAEQAVAAAKAEEMRKQGLIDQAKKQQQTIYIMAGVSGVLLLGLLIFVLMFLGVISWGNQNEAYYY